MSYCDIITRTAVVCHPAITNFSWRSRSSTRWISTSVPTSRGCATKFVTDRRCWYGGASGIGKSNPSSFAKETNIAFIREAIRHVTRCICVHQVAWTLWGQKELVNYCLKLRSKPWIWFRLLMCCSSMCFHKSILKFFPTLFYLRNENSFFTSCGFAWIVKQ